jgi:hypothetical protein
MRTDGRILRHDEANSRFFFFFCNFATAPLKKNFCEFTMILVPLLYSKVSIQMCAVMTDLTCLHSHDAFYLRMNSLDVRGWGV